MQWPNSGDKKSPPGATAKRGAGGKMLFLRQGDGGFDFFRFFFWWKRIFALNIITMCRTVCQTFFLMTWAITTATAILAYYLHPYPSFSARAVSAIITE